MFGLQRRNVGQKDVSRPAAVVDCFDAVHDGPALQSHAATVGCDLRVTRDSLPSSPKFAPDVDRRKGGTPRSRQTARLPAGIGSVERISWIVVLTAYGRSVVFVSGANHA